MMPQPWRGIVDAGVVLGLSLGIVSVLYWFFKALTGRWYHPIPLDLPEPRETVRVGSQGQSEV